MKCIVRKLKATIDNDTLPVFKNVVLKNYITTTQDGQYIPFPDIFSKMNQTKMEAVVEATVDTTSGILPVFGSGANNYMERSNGYFRAHNQDNGELVSVPKNTEVSVGYNSADMSYFIGETTGFCTTQTTSENIYDRMMAFGTYNRLSSKAGAIKIKQVKITTHLNEVYILVPAEINGVAVLYDADRGVYYGEANGGTLVCG